MMHSALYVILIISLVNGLPSDSYLQQISGLSSWFYPQSHTENENEIEIVQAEKDRKKNDDNKEEVFDNEAEKALYDQSEQLAKDSIVKVEEDGDADDAIPVDHLLDIIKEDAPNITQDHERKKTIGVLRNLRNAVLDDSLRKVKVLFRGAWHFVDLGIVGSSQRKRSAEKTKGVLDSLVDLFRAFNKWFWSWFGYPIEDDDDNVSLVMVTDYDENGEKKEGDKDKNGDKDGDKDKDQKDKKKDKKSMSTGDDEHIDKPLKNGGSDDSSAKEGQSKVVLKPLEPDDKTHQIHTSSDGRLVYDGSNNHDHDSEEAKNAMRTLNELSSILDGKLKTREEVDRELKEAQDTKDHKNKYYVEYEAAKKQREDQKDPREWTEDQVLKRLDEINEEIPKIDKMDTDAKKNMVKDILSLSMQPLLMVETYDKIMDTIDKMENGVKDVSEDKLETADEYAFWKKVFSLKNLIQKTPRNKYREEKRKSYEEMMEKERQKHPNLQKWTEPEALERMEKMEKTLKDTPDADAVDMVKDLKSMTLHPFFSFDTYNKMYDIMAILANREKNKVPMEELQDSANLARQSARFSFLDDMLRNPEIKDHEAWSAQTDKAREKRKKHNDTREFSEKQALNILKEMNDKFATEKKETLVNDITNLTMQPLYKVETYNKMSDFIEKLEKDKSATKDELKPAIESLEEEKKFSTEHKIVQKPEGSLARKLDELKDEYVRNTPLSDDEKKKLFEELKILQKEKPKTEGEIRDAVELMKKLGGKNSPISMADLSSLYKMVNMDPAPETPDTQAASGGKKSGSKPAFIQALADYNKNSSQQKTVFHNSVTGLSNIDPKDFKLGKLVGGKLVAA